MSDTPWPHFSRKELECHCGCGVMGMAPDFMAKLEEIRKAYGKPLTITSAYRCPKHNAGVSHTGDSGPHTTGCAVDVRIEGRDAVYLLQVALTSGIKRFGVSQAGPHGPRFLHIDTCGGADYPSPTIWSY